jgi:hypothetical protein
MTPLQQAYLAKLHANAAANLEFFKLNLPQVHQLLVQENPSATLDISDQGDLTVRYADGSVKSVAPCLVEEEKRFEEFADVNRRPQLLAFHNLRAVQETPSHGDMQRYHYSKLDKEFANRVRRHFADHYPDDTGLQRYPSFGHPRHVPLLIVLGSGVGAHLSRLITEYDARHLIVMEPDLEAFRLSLFFQDYVQLSRLAIEKNTDLAFIVGPDIEDLSRGFMGVLRKSLPPFFVHGAALFPAMPKGERLDAIKASISETLWQLFFGLGYFDDELISIRHSFQNLARQLPIYTRAQVVPEEAVAFIIGSGPSLDGLLPLLRQQRDKAVLFSCGTALGPLSHAGIQPDFHLEKERPGIVYEVLTGTVSAEFKKGIHFLGLNVVMPEVFDLFGKSGVVLKEADTIGYLLERGGQVKRIQLDTQPTVTNMALSMALSLGFKRVFLVGVDMGYKDQDRHHSKHTAYLGKLPEADHLRRLLSKKPAGEKNVPGNFGGEATTTNILEMARLHLEHVIRVNPQAKVCNLNDGALIQGALPLPPEQFPEIAGVEDKGQTLRAIEGAFTKEDVDLPFIRRFLLEDVDALTDEVERILGESGSTRASVIDAIVRLYRFLVSDARRSAPASLTFRGTLISLLSLTYNAISIITDEDEAVAKAAFDFDNLLEFLATARAEIVKELDNTSSLTAH